MVTTQGRRTQRAKQRELAIHLGGHYRLRKLKRSTIKQLERERARKLWILPWHRERDQQEKPQIYSPTTLLGLPVELRQQILGASYSMKDLQADALALRLHRNLDVKLQNNLAWAGHVLWTRHKCPKLKKQSSLPRDEQDLFKLLEKRIETLSNVSEIIAGDMKHVGADWRQQLQDLLDQNKQRASNITPLPTTTNNYTKGEGVSNMKKQARRFRPAKCWYCFERHFDNSSVCPTAVESPQKWKRLSKAVGGWRGRAAPKATFQGSKINFIG